MVGGRVYSINNLDDGIDFTVEDDGEYAAITLVDDANSRLIAIGDSLWWQSRTAYWTPQGEKGSDIAIPIIGYSRHVPAEK